VYIVYYVLAASFLLIQNPVQVSQLEKHDIQCPNSQNLTSYVPTLKT
jgi:hypothetical protein